MQRLVVIAILVLAPVPALADIPVLTRTTPLTPTGELVAPGHFEHTQDLTAFEHEYACAPNDRVELRFTSPLVPIPIIGGDLQVRVSVLPPASRVRLVIGASAAAEWMDGGDLWLGGSMTAAYRGDRWSIHATGRAVVHQLEASGDQLYLSTAGVTLAVGKTGVLFAEIGEVAWRRSTCDEPAVAARTSAPTPPAPSCMEVDSGRGFAIGARWGLGHDMAMGVSAIVLRVGATTVPMFPLLSFSWDR